MRLVNTYIFMLAALAAADVGFIIWAVISLDHVEKEGSLSFTFLSLLIIVPLIWLVWDFSNELYEIQLERDALLFASATAKHDHLTEPLNLADKPPAARPPSTQGQGQGQSQHYQASNVV